MRAWLARFDTLFLRLFVLLWVALVGSHLVAFAVVNRGLPSGGPPGAAASPGLPPLPSLPPADLGEARRPPTPGEPPPMPGPGDRPPPPGRAEPGGAGPGSLWLDYAVRAAVIAAFAALGAGWLARPVRALADGSRRLEAALARPAAPGDGPAPIDERRGPREVRETAAVFNAMARRLARQFASRTLFMAAISHDLRTPLARLRLRLEPCGDGAAIDRPAAIADLREMDALIEAVLAALRDERTDEPAQRVDLRALLQAIVDDEAERGLPVSWTDGDEARPAIVRGQPLALRRLAGNLIGNALKHAGSARVGVQRAGETVTVTIDDDGPGIPAAQLDAVFEPFVRSVHGNTDATAAHAGIGLGLYIARELAQRQGGRLELANRPGGGLRASLRLPAG